MWGRATCLTQSRCDCHPETPSHTHPVSCLANVWAPRGPFRSTHKIYSHSIQSPRVTSSPATCFIQAAADFFTCLLGSCRVRPGGPVPGRAQCECGPPWNGGDHPSLCVSPTGSPPRELGRRDVTDGIGQGAIDCGPGAVCRLMERPCGELQGRKVRWV